MEGEREGLSEKEGEGGEFGREFGRRVVEGVVRMEGFGYSVAGSVDVEGVIGLCVAAGDAIMGVYESDASTWDASAKGDGSPLTKADLAANEVICAGLRRMAPHVPIVSEENRQLPYEERKGYAYFWCVDPLDGTKEFLKRNGQFTVNVALCRGDTPVLGVVVTPATGRVHYAVEGQGSWARGRADGHAQAERLRCTTFRDSDVGLTLVASASHNTPETDAFIARYAEAKLTSLGSSLKLLLVAEGKAAVYPRLAPTCEWDTCAAHVVVTEAGGKVLRASEADGTLIADPKDPVLYNKPHPLNPFFVVYGDRRTD